VNLDEDSLTFRREIIKGGMKPTGKDVVFPFYPELRDCAKKLLTFDHRDEYLFPVYDVRKQMKAACKKLGLKHQTPHLLRHVFGTRLVSAENQQHLSIADAAELMCHRDGGKLMLTRYVHVSPSLRTSIQNIRIMRRSSEKPAAPTRKAA
jgi:integrase